MKTAYFVLGPESSGTRMLAQAFVAAGCFGDGGHEQRMDDLDFTDRPDTIVFRQSLPHGDGWPDCPRIIGSMASAGYAVQPVLIVRDKDHTVRSQRARKHAFSAQFSHGMAALVELDDGRTVFAKAIPGDDALAVRYRTEADTVARLPASVPTPAVLFSIETAGWVVTVFEAVPGRHPHLDRPTELAAVLAVVEQLAVVLTPNPLPDVPTIEQSYGPELTGWRQFAEQGPPLISTGGHGATWTG